MVACSTEEKRKEKEKLNPLLPIWYVVGTPNETQLLSDKIISAFKGSFVGSSRLICVFSVIIYFLPHTGVKLLSL